MKCATCGYEVNNERTCGNCGAVIVRKGRIFLSVILYIVMFVVALAYFNATISLRGWAFFVGIVSTVLIFPLVSVFLLARIPMKRKGIIRGIIVLITFFAMVIAYTEGDLKVSEYEAANFISYYIYEEKGKPKEVLLNDFSIKQFDLEDGRYIPVVGSVDCEIVKNNGERERIVKEYHYYYDRKKFEFTRDKE